MSESSQHLTVELVPGDQITAGDQIITSVVYLTPIATVTAAEDCTSHGAKLRRLHLDDGRTEFTSQSAQISRVIPTPTHPAQEQAS